MYTEIQDSRALLNITDWAQSNSYGRGQTKERGMRGQPANSDGRSNSGKGQSLKFCTYCKRNGHTIDTCYKSHGFPLYMKQSRSNVNNVTSDEIEDEGVVNFVSQKGDIQEE